MYWQRGELIYWHYRRPTWSPGQPESLQPVTVVRDDQRGLVAWLAPKTELIKTVLPTGAGLRSAPLTERFSVGRAAARAHWRGPGVLCAAPLARPWSVRLFWDEDWRFEGWYVNLEKAHVRDGRRVLSSDHVLDVWIEPNGDASLKDEDELSAAVDQGRFTPSEAETIRGNAEAAIASFRAREWPFDEPWPVWRPDPSWIRPTLPEHARWDFDEIGPPH